MLRVMLPDQTAEKLQRVAERQGVDATQLLVQLVENHLADDSLPPEAVSGTLWSEQEQKINQEQKQYEAQHSALLKHYSGEYIAMHQGAVVDHDDDRVVLRRRVRARFGDTPVLITPVLTEARQIIIVHSPRLLEAGQ
jgi:hypothetical protein